MKILYFMFYLYFVIYTKAPDKAALFKRSQEKNELDQQLKNAVCCVNKMKCCQNSTAPDNIIVRAILIRCPGRDGDVPISTRKHKRPILPNRKQSTIPFPGIEEDELLAASVLRNCRKKLILTIKLASKGLVPLKNEYIVIDHVYDAQSRTNARLISPYVIKIKQEPIMQMYALRYHHVVNSLAREEILNKHQANYTGCDATSYIPTCGRITYKGKVIPFSAGFCCSCDAELNRMRQSENHHPYSERMVSYSNPEMILDGIECPKNVRGQTITPSAESLLNSSVNAKPIEQKVTQSNNKLITADKNNTSNTNTTLAPKQKGKQTDQMLKHYFDPESGFVKNKDELDMLEQSSNNSSHVYKRQVSSSGVQRRGGQNCADRFTPKGLDSKKYHESTHCLRFSDLWYTVYQLEKPVLEHSILFQIFEKVEDMSGKVGWRDLTSGKMVRVGTVENHYINEKVTISIKYDGKPQHVDESLFSFNHKEALLLVPEATPNNNLTKYHELRAGPSEYLIIHHSQLTTDGSQCNKAGVGFEGFVKQPNRCACSKNSCLDNQPHHLWLHDHNAEKLGKKGCFFLKHFGKLPANPIRKHPTTNAQFLLLEYTGSFSSSVDMEIRANFNTIISRISMGTITEVYVDSTSPSRTILTIKISNAGLISGSFIARLTDCPSACSFTNIECKPALIPPQHQHIFNLEINSPLHADRFHCSVEALNANRELVALRRIRLQKFDRCICTWHCLCACLGSAEGLKCIPMSLQHYHAAGFQGALPVNTVMIRYTFIDDVISLIAHTCTFLVILLFLLGFFKAVIGTCCIAGVGDWGLDVILDLPRPMPKYLEKDLSRRRVYYDIGGWPIHPDTKERVRSVARSTEICLNLIFFFVYPFYIFLSIMRRVLFPKYVHDLSTVKEEVKPTGGSVKRTSSIEKHKSIDVPLPDKARIVDKPNDESSFDDYSYTDTVTEQQNTVDSPPSDMEGKGSHNELKAITEVSEPTSSTDYSSISAVKYKKDDQSGDDDYNWDDDLSRTSSKSD